MITLKLAIAILAFILSSGQIVFQTFQHHHAVNPKHGAIKFIVFVLSSLSLVYLAKDIYADFEDKKTNAVAAISVATPVEKNYWDEIYRNPSPEKYCSYLEKYPNGLLQYVAIAKNAVHGDCLQVRLQAEAELKRKSEAAAAVLKEKIDNETKALAEKNALLEQQAQKNAARLDITEAELAALKAKAELNAEAQREAELKTKFESENNSIPITELQTIEKPKHAEVELKNKAATEVEQPLF